MITFNLKMKHPSNLYKTYEYNVFLLFTLGKIPKLKHKMNVTQISNLKQIKNIQIN